MSSAEFSEFVIGLMTNLEEGLEGSLTASEQGQIESILHGALRRMEAEDG